MVDSHDSWRLGRRISFKSTSPSSGDRGHPGQEQQSRCAYFPKSGLHEDSGGVTDEVKILSGAKASEDVAASDQAAVDRNGLRGKEMETPSLLAQVRRACLALGVYVLLSILTVFWTKHLVGGNIPTPLFLSWVQQAVGLILHSVISAIVASIGDRGSALGRALIMAVPVVRVRARVMLRVLPLSICFVGMIGSSNLCLQRVQVSVYQVARSLTLVFSLLLSVLWLKQKVGKGEVCSCLLVASGFALMTVVGSDAASVSGYVIGALASLFQATYTVQMKATLNSLQQEGESLVRPSKTRPSYQMICSNSSYANSGISNATTREEVSASHIDKEVDDSAVLMLPSLVARSSGADDSLSGNLHLDDEFVGVDEKRIDVMSSPLADGSKSTGGNGLQGLPVGSGPTDSEARSMDIELEDRNRGGQSRSTSPGTPHVEPICMFYNMLNALCLFPLVIIISNEPQVLWNLASEGSAWDTTVLAQVIGLGTVTFALGTSIFWTVSLTSPLSFSVAGYVKTLLQVAVAMAVWGERLSYVETCGFLLTLSGSLWYSISRCSTSQS